MIIIRISFLCEKVLTFWRNCFLYKVKYTLFCMALMVFPIQDGYFDSDSSETNITLLGGGGSYAVITRGCSGEVLQKKKTSFSEISGSIDHKFVSLPLRIGIRSSYINDNVISSFYNQNNDLVPQTYQVKIFTANPFFNIEGKLGAIGVGYFYADHSLASGGGVSRNDPSFSIYAQLGSRNGVYGNMSYLHSPSIYTQGFLQLGIGTWKNKKADLWFGLGGLGPYDHLGFMAKTRFRVSRTIYLNINGRFGTAEGISEHGFNVGVTYRLVK